MSLEFPSKGAIVNSVFVLWFPKQAMKTTLTSLPFAILPKESITSFLCQHHGVGSALHCNVDLWLRIALNKVRNFMNREALAMDAKASLLSTDGVPIIVKGEMNTDEEDNNLKWFLVFCSFDWVAGLL